MQPSNFPVHQQERGAEAIKNSGAKLLIITQLRTFCAYKVKIY